MTAHRTMAHVVLLLLIVVTSGCAEPKPRGEVVTEADPRGDYATLRRVDRSGPTVRFRKLRDIEETSPPWLELQVHYRGDSSTFLIAYDDQLVCMRRWQPWAHGGYVLFEPGTDSPISYAGAFGVCVTEPPMSKRHKEVDELTCSFTDEQVVRVHGFAWPDEAESEEEAMALSQRRAEAIKIRLGSSALPNRFAGIEAHGTRRTGVSGDHGPEVIGAYFEIHPAAEDDTRIGLPVTPQFFVDTATAPPKSMRADLEALLASSGIKGVPAENVGRYDDPGYELVEDDDGNLRRIYSPFIKLTYRPKEVESFDDATVYMAAWKQDEFRDVDIVRWAEQVIDDECGASKPALRPREQTQRTGEEK